MMWGLRLVLLIGIVCVAVPFLAFFLTRNQKFYRFAMRAGKATLLIAAILALLFIGERLLLAV